MTAIETFASFGKANAVADALKIKCQHASIETYLGFHVHCSSDDADKRASMEPKPDYCILHTLMARQGDGVDTVFVCPAGLDPSTILEIGRRIEPSYK